MQTRETTDQTLFDIFVTACEGGINYWAGISSYHIWDSNTDGDEHIADIEGFCADIFDHDDFDFPVFTIDRNTIERGLRRMAEAQGPYYDPNGKRTNCASVPYLGSWHHDIAVSLLENPEGFCDWDASFADEVVQVGLFGEVRYG